MSGFLRGFFSLGTLALGTMTEVALVTAGKAVELAMLNQTNEAHAIIAALLQQNSETNPGFPITRCIPSVMQFSYEIAEDLPPEIEAAKFDEEGMERLEEGSLQHVAYWLEGVNIGKDATEQDFAKLNSLIKEWESRIDNWSRGERVSAGLAGLLSIALHLNKTDEADDIMSRIASRIHETRQSEYISHIRPAWRIYFQSGWLRDRLGLTKDELKQYGEFVFNSTKKRLEEGRAKPSDEYKDKSFKDMLEELDQNTLRFPEEYENMLYEENMLDDDDDGGETRGEKKERFSEYQQYIAPPTILRKPATASQIAEVESKLGHSLPQDLKDFYALTNGTRLAISGPGLYMLIDYFPKVENIHWDTEVANLYNFELLPWGELPVRVEWPTIEAAIAMHPDRGEWNYAWYLEGELIVKARNALEAAYQKAGEVEKIILDKMVKDYHGSWAQLRDLQSCWYTAMGEVPEGTAVFPTFRDYLSLVVFESRYEEDKSPLKLPEGVFL